MGGWKRIGRAQAPSRGKDAGMGREVNGIGNEEREKTDGSGWGEHVPRSLRYWPHGVTWLCSSPFEHYDCRNAQIPEKRKGEFQLAMSGWVADRVVA